MIALNVLADTGFVKPVNKVSFELKQIQKLDSFLEARVTIHFDNEQIVLSEEKTSLSMGRICSCQILNLESSNYDHRHVVLLAERKNDGSSAAYSAAKLRIQKEKKHLKKMFYDKVSVVAELQGTGSCKSMYYQLRSADKNLQLYEILNAD